MPLPGFHYFGTICPEVLKAGGILVVPPGQDKPTRLRASTLGDGFDSEDM